MHIIKVIYKLIISFEKSTIIFLIITSTNKKVTHNILIC